MDYRLAFNSTDTPVLISKDGRSLGGGEFGPVDVDDKTAQAAVDAGQLVLRDDAEDVDADQRSEQASAAITELEALRAEQASTDSGTQTTRRGGSRATTPKE